MALASNAGLGHELRNRLNALNLNASCLKKSASRVRRWNALIRSSSPASNCWTYFGKIGTDFNRAMKPIIEILECRRLLSASVHRYVIGFYGYAFGGTPGTGFGNEWTRNLVDDAASKGGGTARLFAEGNRSRDGREISLCRHGTPITTRRFPPARSRPLACASLATASAALRRPILRAISTKRPSSTGTS